MVLVKEQESDTIGNLCTKLLSKVSNLHRHTQTTRIYNNIYVAHNTHTRGKPDPGTATGPRTPTCSANDDDSPCIFGPNLPNTKNPFFEKCRPPVFPSSFASPSSCCSPPGPRLLPAGHPSPVLVSHLLLHPFPLPRTPQDFQYVFVPPSRILPSTLSTFFSASASSPSTTPLSTRSSLLAQTQRPTCTFRRRKITLAGPRRTGCTSRCRQMDLF